MILQRIQKALSASGLQPDGGKVLVAFSGGADSTCLLLALHDLGYDIEAMHCNFELRGTASDADEAFCRRLCKACNVPISVRHMRTRSYAQRRGVSIEMAARELRYEWFAERAEQIDAQALCVAHHRDDNVETILLNLIRGTGLHGLVGMKQSAKMPLLASDKTSSCPVVRPMLDVSRVEIEEWLVARGQDWVTDQTNMDADAALRNKIRLCLLPLMEEMNPRVREGLAETATRLRGSEVLADYAVDELRRQVTRDDDSLDIAALKRLPSAPALMHELLLPLGFTAEQVREIIDGLDGEPGHVWTSRTGVRLLRDRGRLQIDKSRGCDTELHYLPLSGVFEVEGVRIVIERQAINGASFNVPRDSSTACFDLEKLTLPLVVRRVREGDRFQPFGMDGTKLVSDFLTDRKMSLFDKERQLVVCSGERIVWVVGLRVAGGFEVDASTRHIMTIRKERC